MSTTTTWWWQVVLNVNYPYVRVGSTPKCLLPPCEGGKRDMLLFCAPTIQINGFWHSIVFQKHLNKLKKAFGQTKPQKTTIDWPTTQQRHKISNTACGTLRFCQKVRKYWKNIWQNKNSKLPTVFTCKKQKFLRCKHRLLRIRAFQPGAPWFCHIGVR